MATESLEERLAKLRQARAALKDVPVETKPSRSDVPAPDQSAAEKTETIQVPAGPVSSADTSPPTETQIDPIPQANEASGNTDIAILDSTISQTDRASLPKSKRGRLRAALNEVLTKLGARPPESTSSKPIRGPRDLAELKQLNLKEFASREAALWSIVGAYAERKLRGEGIDPALNAAINNIRSVLVSRNKSEIEALYKRLTS